MQALEIALRPDVKRYKQALEIAQRWIAGESMEAAPSEVDLAIRFLGGEAAMGYLKTLPPPTPEQAGLHARRIEWIRDQYTAVATAAGPYQAKAKVRLLDPALGGTPSGEPGNFTEVRNRIRAALDRMLVAEAEQKTAERSGVGNDADSRRQRQEQIAAARSEGLKYCQETLDKPVPTVPPDDLDTVRYYQAYLHYSAGELEKAAAEGEAMVRSTGDSPAARQAARIGLAAREALFGAAKGDSPIFADSQRASENSGHSAKIGTVPDSRTAATEQLRSLAERIVQRWSSYTEANDARAVLADLALADGRMEQAEDYLQKMSERSLRRGETELAIGLALWRQAEQLQQTSTLEHDHSADADKLTARAAELLGKGIARIKARSTSEGGTDSLACAAGLYGDSLFALAQIEMLRGRSAEAIVLLEDRNAEAARDSYSLPLLAYIAAEQLDKAQHVPASYAVVAPAAGQSRRARQTIQAGVRFQRLLRQYLTHYRDRRMDDVLRQTVQRCEEFLAAPAEGPEEEKGDSPHLPERPGGGHHRQMVAAQMGTVPFFVLAWRAEAYAGLAAGLDNGGPAVAADTERHYRRAIAAFQDVLHRAAGDPAFAQAEVIVALRIDLARCLRRMSDYAQALNPLLTVLKEHPRMVDAQVEAAYTYQAWGEERPEYLEIAIQGGNNYREVWGWGELARRVQSEPRFREVFHEARYNLALCRFRQAQTEASRPQRRRLAKEAENDILATRRAAPDMGGSVWYDKYNELFKRIQRLADEPAVGLPNP